MGYFHIEVNIAVGAQLTKWRHLVVRRADIEMHVEQGREVLKLCYFNLCVFADLP